MGIQYTRERIRAEVDVVSQEPFLDAITAETPSMWRGTDLAIELGFFYGTAGVIDITPFSSVTVEIRDAETRKVVLATATLAAASMNPSLTGDQWEAGTHQHGVWTWPKEATRWDLQGQLQRDYWLVISAITSDLPPRAVTLGATTLTVVEDGAGEDANSPLPGDPLYLTAAETAAMIGQVIRPGNNPPGATIMLRSPNGQFGRIIGVDDQGAAFDSLVTLS